MTKNFSKVFKVFEKNYQPIPLEVFGKDPYKSLVSTILSSRTKDETTLKASTRLFKVAPSLSKLNKLKVMEIQGLIYPVGFYKTKAKHIKNSAKIILKKYKGQVPNKIDELVALPGVGRKTANLVLNRAFGIPAIAVDTHVHKISNMLTWVKTKTPEETERGLREILPKKYWSEVNRLFVSIGRRYTTKKRLETFLKENQLISKQ